MGPSPSAADDGSGETLPRPAPHRASRAARKRYEPGGQIPGDLAQAGDQADLSDCWPSSPGQTLVSLRVASAAPRSAAALTTAKIAPCSVAASRISPQPGRSSVGLGASSPGPMIFQTLLKIRPASRPPSMLAIKFTALYNNLIIVFSTHLITECSAVSPAEKLARNHRGHPSKITWVIRRLAPR